MQTEQPQPTNKAAGGASDVERVVRGKLTAKQKRMKKAVEWLRIYMRDYDKQPHYTEYTDEIFIDDVLYGLGVALHGKNVTWASGYEVWKQTLRSHLGQAPNAQVQRDSGGIIAGGSAGTTGYTADDTE